MLESFYDPRDRVQIYFAGHNAMASIQQEAAEAANTYLKDDNGNFKDSFFTIPDLIPNSPDADSKSGLQSALSVGYNGAKELADAMGSINASIINQALNKSVRPDIQKISSEINQSITAATTKATNAAAANGSVHTQLLIAAAPNTSPQRPSESEIEIKAMVNFAATFDKNVIACKAISGT